MSLKLKPSAPGTYNMSPITGTGSRVSALNIGQHRCPVGSMEDNPFFTGEVPQGLLRDCEKKRTDALAGTARKATNLYRRVSTVNYKTHGKVKKEHLIKSSSVKCFVCLVSLVKSSKDRQRAGVKLRCKCNVRVCATCFKNNTEWHLTEPHFTKCVTLRGFICPLCACFYGVKEKVCCIWMCPRCSSERKTEGLSCPKCSGRSDGCSRRGTRALWSSRSNESRGRSRSEATSSFDVDCSEEKIADYRDLIRSRVFDKVSRSRHLSPSDIRTLFYECFAPQVCTCRPAEDGALNPMCASCTPVLTVMQLLANNPRPLMASLAERAIPGRALTRNVYNRDLLIRMLNDRDLPLCPNGRLCKGMLVTGRTDPSPLPSLISTEAYESFTSLRDNTGEVQPIDPCRCILCLLFNQSAAVAQMVSSEGLHLEPHPSGPVYYFNVKLSPDVGVPEVCIDELQGYLVNFEGSVGSYKPTFYYNWRDMVTALNRDIGGKITFVP